MARFVTADSNMLAEFAQQLAKQEDERKQRKADKQAAKLKKQGKGNFSKMSEPDDVRRAANLRRSAALADGKKTQGPRVAR